MRPSNPDDELDIPVQDNRKLSKNDEDLKSDVMSVIDYRPPNVKQDYFNSSIGVNFEKNQFLFHYWLSNHQCSLLHYLLLPHNVCRIE